MNSASNFAPCSPIGRASIHHTSPRRRINQPATIEGNCHPRAATVVDYSERGARAASETANDVRHIVLRLNFVGFRWPARALYREAGAAHVDFMRSRKGEGAPSRETCRRRRAARARQSRRMPGVSLRNESICRGGSNGLGETSMAGPRLNPSRARSLGSHGDINGTSWIYVVPGARDAP